jgi:hypothetical protein
MTNAYFVLAVLNNLCIHMGFSFLHCGRSFVSDNFIVGIIVMMQGVVGITAGSVATILVLHQVVIRRLASMGQDRYMKKLLRVEYASCAGLLVGIVIIFGAMAQNGGDITDPLVLLGFLICGGSVVSLLLDMILLAAFASMRFYRALKEVETEIAEGAAKDLQPVLTAARMQYRGVVLGSCTGAIYLPVMGWYLAFGLANSMGYFVPDAAVIVVCFYVGLFFDSVFNDLCTHLLSFAVIDGSLGEAQKIAEDRAARAADELRQCHERPEPRAERNAQVGERVLTDDHHSSQRHIVSLSRF